MRRLLLLISIIIITTSIPAFGQESFMRPLPDAD